LPFHVAILTVVVGLLFVTCAFLIGYGFYAGQKNIELLKFSGGEPGMTAGIVAAGRPARASTPSPPDISADRHPQPAVADQSSTAATS
jgi:hypothetical protein